MKKKSLTFLLLSFLALGVGFTTKTEKLDNTTVAKAATTQKINVSRGSWTIGAGAEMFLDDKPQISKDDITVKLDSFEGEGAYASYTKDSINVNSVDVYDSVTGRLYVVLNIGFDYGVAHFKAGFFVEYNYNGTKYNGIVVINGDEIESVTGPIISLGAPTDTTIADGVLTWTDGNDATSHDVHYLNEENGIHGEEALLEENVTSPHELSKDLPVGNYFVQVRSVLNEDTKSEWVDCGPYSIAAEDATQLEQPTNVHVVEGQLNFDLVDHASSYDVEYYLNSVSQYTENITTVPHTLVGSEILGFGSFTIKVRAVGDQINYSDSQYVDAEELYELVRPVANLTITTWGDGFYGGQYAHFRLAWDYDCGLKSNAKKYTVNGVTHDWFDWINDTDVNLMVGDGGTQPEYVICFYDEDDNLIAQGTYVNKIEVPDEPQTLTPPVGLVINADARILAFANVANASYYHVQYRVDNDEVKYEHDIQNGGRLDPNDNYDIGTYNIYIKSVGDGEHYLDSDYAFAGQFVITYQMRANDFIAKWRAISSTEEGKTFCDIIDERQNEFNNLISEYEKLDVEIKNLIDATAFNESGTTFGEHIEFVKATIAKKQASSPSTDVLTKLVNDNTNSLTSIIIIVSGLLITIVGYIAFRKKELVK